MSVANTHGRSTVIGGSVGSTAAAAAAAERWQIKRIIVPDAKNKIKKKKLLALQTLM